MSFFVLNILDALRDLGEEIVTGLISTFKCALNAEIQDFLQNNAINFAKKKISVTYLVINQSNELVAYFTVTHKPVLIPTGELEFSKTQRKRLERFSVFKSENGEHHASAFLIAQFGKNTGLEAEKTYQVIFSWISHLQNFAIFNISLVVGLFSWNAKTKKSC